MKTLFIVLALLSPSIARANTVTPQFTTGNMTSTTVTKQTIKEVTKKEVYGAAVKTWSGTNVKATGSLGADGTTYAVEDATKAWQFETTTRAAGVIEKWDITTDYTCLLYTSPSPRD